MENQAEYQISSSLNDGFLEVVITGNAIGSTFDKMINELDAILKANRAEKTILDIRALDGRLDHSQIYRYVRNYPSVIYDIQSAIVDLPKNAHYETAAKNAGLLSWKWFTDVDTARKWLKSEQLKGSGSNL
jgi:hypothetical protein